MSKMAIVSGERAIRALERLGFTRARQKGSHVILRRQSVGVVVPLHDPLKAGTLAGILRQAGVSREAFLEALR